MLVLMSDERTDYARRVEFVRMVVRAGNLVANRVEDPAHYSDNVS
jgi:hypothetical protein